MKTKEKRKIIAKRKLNKANRNRNKARGYTDHSVKRENLKKTDRDKTSIAVKLKNDDKPGALVDLLKEFQEKNINLLKIESKLDH